MAVTYTVGVLPSWDVFNDQSNQPRIHVWRGGGFTVQKEYNSREHKNNNLVDKYLVVIVVYMVQYTGCL